MAGSQTFLGYMLELEYSPLGNLKMARPLMEELVQVWGRCGGGVGEVWGSVLLLMPP